MQSDCHYILHCSIEALGLDGADVQFTKERLESNQARTTGLFYPSKAVRKNDASCQPSMYL